MLWCPVRGLVGYIVVWRWKTDGPWSAGWCQGTLLGGPPTSRVLLGSVAARGRAEGEAESVLGVGRVFVSVVVVVALAYAERGLAGLGVFGERIPQHPSTPSLLGLVD